MSTFREQPAVSEHVLFVHAHPDDETITTGGTIAALLDRGATVTVLTCTRGELGEVIPADIKQLEGDGAALAVQRTGELEAAMATLGVIDHRFLGDPGARLAGLTPRRYTDSGMRWGTHGAEPLPNIAADALCAADFGEVAADIATVIDEVRPDAVVSYAADGGYGHPDHVFAHAAARRAADVFSVPFFAIADPGSAEEGVDIAAQFDRKREALRAYRSQVSVDGDTFALSSGPARPIARVERFRRIDPDERDSVDWKDQGLGTHLITYLLALVVGLALGGIATVNHQLEAQLFGTTVPYGIVAALGLIAVYCAGLRLVFPGRFAAGAGVVGVLVAIGTLSLAGGGTSVVVPANPSGYALTYGSVVIALITLAWPASGWFSRDKIGRTAEPKGKTSP